MGWWCRWRGHNWLGMDRREFVPVTDMCLRCGARRVYLPTGQCLSGHPLADHWDENGGIKIHPTCSGPR